MRNPMTTMDPISILHHGPYLNSNDTLIQVHIAIKRLKSEALRINSVFSFSNNIKLGVICFNYLYELCSVHLFYIVKRSDIHLQ